MTVIDRQLEKSPEAPQAFWGFLFLEMALLMNARDNRLHLCQKVIYYRRSKGQWSILDR
jgi:hypothetical protein